MFKTPKLAKKTLWFFQKELTHDFESKFESCIFCNICLDRVRRDDDTNKQKIARPVEWRWITKKEWVPFSLTPLSNSHL